MITARQTKDEGDAMPSMKTYIDLLERLQSINVRVDAQRCLAVRNRNIACGRCAQACTSGCISINNGHLDVRPDRCIGCGTCASACPTGALSPRKPDDRALARSAAAAMRATNGTVVFACEQLLHAAGSAIDPETVVAVRCIGRVDVSLLALLASAGAKTLRLTCGNCEQCEYATGKHVAEGVCQDANTVLAAWRSTTRATVSPKLPACCRAARKASWDPERRAFLQSARDLGRDAATDAAELAIDRAFDHETNVEHTRRAAMETGALPRFLPPRRAVLLDALKRMGNPNDTMIGTHLWGHAVIDEDRCSSCGMCSTFCPTGALTKRESDAAAPGSPTWLASRNGISRITLAHAPELCLQCRTCEQLCPERALVLSDEVFAIDIGRGCVDEHRLRDIHRDKGGPDAIRNSMSKLINSPYVTG